MALPPEALEAIAQRAADIVLERIETAAPAAWLTVDEAAAYTRIPKQTLYKRTAARAIPHCKPGGKLLFKRDDLDAWLEQYREGPAAGVPRLRGLPGREVA